MRYIIYKRVSTKKQGKSGLGLEAQEDAIQNFLKKEDEVIYSFTEVESGRKNNRPNLLKALSLCRDTGATLLVAKLDRLSRNAPFCFSIVDSGIDVKCCDMPHADRFMFRFFGIVAEWEAERIQQRIKEALAAKKERGEKLGNIKNLTGQKYGQAANRQKFLDRVKPMRELILHFIKEGKTNAEIFLLIPKFDSNFIRPFGDRAVKYVRKEYEEELLSKSK